MGRFRTVEGVVVPDLTGVAEGYTEQTAPAGHTVFTVNVSAERTAAVFRELTSEIEGTGFLVLETPTHRDVEATLRQAASDPFHIDVHHLDGLTLERAHALFAAHERILVHDGRVSFGFGAHRG